MNVNAVVEVDKPGEIVDSGPLDGFARSKAFPDRRQCRTVGPNLGMTISFKFSSAEFPQKNYPLPNPAVASRRRFSLEFPVFLASGKAKSG
jgi:hypothetical protein